MRRRTAGCKAAFACVLGLAVLPAGAEGTLPIPELIDVPAGVVVMGSDRAEREAAYGLDEAAYGHSVTRENRWYESEGPRRRVETGAYSIAEVPITNRQYAAFIAATGHRAPDVDAETWASSGLIHPYQRTRRHAWTDGEPPAGRESHPVVLVSRADAEAYAAWLSRAVRGHFHTFCRRGGMPVGCEPVPYAGAVEWPRGKDAVSHLIAISMDRHGYPIGLFATNRWVTGEAWCLAEDVIRMVGRFEIDHAYPSWPTNRWLTAMFRLFRLEIEALLRSRDEVIARWAAERPDVDVYEERALEITGELRISVDEQIERVREALWAAEQRASGVSSPIAH